MFPLFQPQPTRTLTPTQEATLQTAEQFLMEGLPVAAIAHSLHVDALADPTLNTNPQFQAFSLIELNELHHQIAALGGLLRTQMGDPSGPASLAMNMAGFLENRALGLQAARTLPARVRNHPAVAAVMQLTDLSNQQIASYAPALSPLMQVLPSVSPGPMLVAPNP